MKKKLLTLSLISVLLLTTACGKEENPKLSKKNKGATVAEIDGFKITTDELYNELKISNGYDVVMNKIDAYIANKEVADSEEITSYVNEYIEYLKSSAAQYNVDLVYFVKYYAGLANINSEEELKNYLTSQYKINKAVEKQVGTRFTAEEIEKYYTENYSEILTVRHILIEFDEDEDTYDEAYNTALNLIGKLNETDSKDLTEKFESLAFEYSADGSYNTGGLIEDFVAGDVVSEFYQASSELEVNAYTKVPVKTQFGYHIILKVSEKEKPTLESVTDEIKGKLATAAISADQLLQYEAMNELREKYNLVIKDTDIEKSHNDFLDQLEKQ